MPQTDSKETLLARIRELEGQIESFRRNELDLNANHERYRRLTENLPVAVYSALPDRASSSFFISGRMEDLTGYKAEQFMADATLFARILHPEDNERVRTAIRTSIKTKTSFDMEYRIITRDGRTRWIRDRAAPIFENGSLLRVEGVMEDITAARTAHEAVKEASRCWRNTFDAMREAMFTLDRDFRILQCNRAMRDLLGMPEAQIIGRHCWELIHKTDKPLDNCPCMRVAQSLVRESIVIDFNQLWLEVTVDPQFDDFGNISTYIHVMSDITEYIQSENALREAHQTLLTVLDSIDATIYVADVQTHEILFMNRHMKEVYDGDFTGRTCWQALHGLAGPCANCTGGQLNISTAAPQGLCIWEGHNPLTGRWYVNSVRAIRWFDGRTVRLQVATDITEIKSLEKERLHTEARLRQAQKMEAIGTLAGGIAHDFNNILSAILGYSELALDDALNDRASVNFIRQIIKAGYRARELVQQILTFSRQTESEAKPIQIKPIVKEALKLLRASLPTTIEIRIDICSESLVNADPTQIHQVIMNLCTNAGHAMRQDGGILNVTLADEELGRDSLAAFPGLMPGRYLRLSVSDTGHGIHPSIIDKIFDPYFTTKEKGEGTGMGLAVVQGIVQSCGGTIVVRSTPGQGTAFSVYLPSLQQEAARKAEVESVVPGGQESILFVDDEPALADLGKQLLEKLGYTITICTSSIEALSLFEKDPHTFDLIITDMTMPQMTGDILAQKIMALRPEIPIVICTGYSERITQELIERLNIKGFVMKPLVRNELALVIRQALEEAE